MLGLATVRKTPPILQARHDQTSGRFEHPGGDHFEPLRGDGQVRRQPAALPAAPRWTVSKQEGVAGQAKLASMELAKRWLHRDEDKIP